MDEARDQGSAGSDSVPPRVFGGTLMAGLLLAALVATAARGAGPVQELVEELAQDVASDEDCRSCR